MPVEVQEWKCDCCQYIWEVPVTEPDPEECPNCTGCDKVPHLHDGDRKIRD